MPAPRKALSFKKVKRATPEETAAMLPKLKLIKAKHAARVLQLSRSALQAMKELETIETAMDLEAAAEVHDGYIDYLPDFKLTFEAVYAQHDEDAAPRIDDCMDVLAAIEKDAAAALDMIEGAAQKTCCEAAPRAPL